MKHVVDEAVVEVLVGLEDQVRLTKVPLLKVGLGDQRHLHLGK